MTHVTKGKSLYETSKPHQKKAYLQIRADQLDQSVQLVLLDSECVRNAGLYSRPLHRLEERHVSDLVIALQRQAFPKYSKQTVHALQDSSFEQCDEGLRTIQCNWSDRCKNFRLLW